MPISGHFVAAVYITVPSCACFTTKFARDQQSYHLDSANLPIVFARALACRRELSSIRCGAAAAARAQFVNGSGGGRCSKHWQSQTAVEKKEPTTAPAPVPNLEVMAPVGVLLLVQ
jgi:hypothetical protein